MVQKKLSMRREAWLVGAAVVLLSAVAVGAEGPDVEFGPIQPIQLSEYWLGLGCYPVDEALRAHLGLPEGQGLLVERIVPDAPAAKAGIERHDVLVKAGDKPLSSIQDLVDAVDAAKDQEVSLQLVRRGEEMTIQVKPAKRPEPVPDQVRPMPRFREWDQFRNWFERMRPGEGGRPPMRFRFLNPGMILPPGAKTHPPIPGNVSVTITRSGDEPAKIVVKRDGETWELTENDLDKLPDDLRVHVERMLGRVPPGWQTDDWSFDFVPDWDWGPRMEGLPGQPLEKQMEDLDRRLEQLRRSIDELRQRRPRLREAPGPEPEESPKPELKAPEQKQEQV